MNYYLLEQDFHLEGTLALGDYPSELDPLEWIKGAKVVPDPVTPVSFKLSRNSGDFRTAVIDSIFTLFSSDLRQALDEFGIDNIDYYPTELHHPSTGNEFEGYWMVNVMGRIEAVDRGNSEYEEDEFGPPTLESFFIDKGAVGDISLFRLDEKPTLIIISEELKEHLAAKKLPGLLMRSTAQYNGSVSGSRFL